MQGLENPYQHGAVVHTCSRAGGYDTRKANTGGIYQKPANERTENVMRGESCFALDTVLGTSSVFGGGPPIHTCFNGTTAMSREELKEHMIFNGVAVADTPFNERTSRNDGVTAQVGGIATIINTGKYKLSVGDTVIITPPKEDLSNCSTVPVSLGLKASEKLRPVTKKLNYRAASKIKRTLRQATKGPQDATSTDSFIKNPAAAYKLEHAVEKPECATWLAIKAVSSVACAMHPFILETVKKYLTGKKVVDADDDEGDQVKDTIAVIAEFMKKVGVQLAGTDATFDGISSMGQFEALMMELPYASPSVLRFTYRGTPLDFNECRKTVVEEHRKRLTVEGMAYGDTTKTDIAQNSFTLPKKSATPTAKRHRSNPALDYEGAISVVTNLPKMLTHEGEMALAKKSRRVCGTVLGGGEPGHTMHILLSGSKIAGAQ